MQNRLVLAGLTIAAWIALKVIDIVVPWPAILFLLCVTLTMMVGHSMWLLFAQFSWRKRLAKSKNQVFVKEIDSWEPWVDILISAKNEGRVIETTVRRFFEVDYTKFHLWVIDDNSDDDMPLVLSRLKVEFPRLKVLTRAPGSRPGKSAALNDALPLTKGEVIAVFDADAFVQPDFFHKILPVLAEEGVGAVQAQKRFFEHQSGWLVECQASEYAMDTYFQMGRDLIGGTVELRGNGQLIKREALIDVGGWNNNSITDDLDLSMRLLVSRWDIRFCPFAPVFEEAVMSIKGLLRQRRRWAEGSIRRYLDYILPINTPSRLSFIDRLDLLAFTCYFAVPGLMILEIISEVISFATGGQIYVRMMLLISAIVYVISLLNCFIAVRLYRNKGWVEAFFHSFEVNTYIYAHWMPVVTISFLRIVSGRGAPKWHRTEHAGLST